MSVQFRGDGTPYVRYRPEGKNGPQRKKTFPLGDYGSLELAHAAAVSFDARLKLDKAVGRSGPVAASRTTLDLYAQEWFRDYAVGNLAVKTLRDYAELWDRHLLRRVGSWTFAKCRPAAFVKLRQDLEHAGLGDATIAKALGLLQAMFREAVLWDYVDANPLREVPKPSAGRKRAVRPLAPLEVELIRAELVAGGEHESALLLSLLHYAGLRPGEALALEWERVLANTLVIDSAISLGEEKTTKNRRNRSVQLLAPLRADLLAYQARTGARTGLVFAWPEKDRRGRKQRRAGQVWTNEAYRNWRTRSYTPARAAVGLPAGRPYDGRHSFASLLLHQGETVAYVAEQLGDAIDTIQATYLHVIEALRGVGPIDAEAQIKTARFQAPLNLKAKAATR